MSEGKDRYEERRRLENENVILREQKENRRLKNEAHLEEGAVIVMDGLRGFFDGTARLFVEPMGDGVLRIKFVR